ncbi:MAG TPA: hypothetical protein VMK12_14090, partial [Anaeromyxobacteraceae bacterium]|nr:hypothetical protein [Anaeromyxobacteraceae bacterium]
MAGEDRPQSSPGCLARLAERWSAGGGARLVSGAVVLAVALGGAWLFDPGASLERMPGDDLLGTRAKSDIVAVRDHEIFDAEATRERRDLAEASEPPVFDWDERAAAEASARVTDAFAALR